MIHLIAAVLLLLPFGDPLLEELDAEFRTSVMETLPDDYGEVSATGPFQEAAFIAQDVYGPHASHIGELALLSLEDIPPAPEGLIHGLTLRDSLDLEGLGLLDILACQVEEMDGYFYMLRFWEAAAAAGMAKSMFLARLVTPAQLGGRTMYERLVPDRYLLLEGPPENPVLAIVSLRDVFTVELVLEQSGCFVPVRICWYE